MKNLSIALVLLLACAAAAQPEITVVGNSIDLPLVQGYLDNYRAAGVAVTAISAQQLPAHMNDSIIMILGGQRAPEGVGEISGGILTDSEKNQLLSSPNAKVFVIAANVWASKQKVYVFAGYEKEQTRSLFGETQGDILKALRFNDSALPQNSTAATVPVPPIDPTQPFTEVDAYQANSIIQNIPGLQLYDVRGVPFYDAGHIPGAASQPERQLAGKLGTLDKSRTYLLYCGGNSESIAAGNLMSAEGFKNIYRLVDGYVAWRRAGFPREKTG